VELSECSKLFLKLHVLQNVYVTTYVGNSLSYRMSLKQQ